jgi:hypothetical protein
MAAPRKATRDQLDDLLSPYPAEVQKIALKARKTLLKWLPGADEAVSTSPRMLAYSYGPGYKGMVCTMILSQSGVKLGLANGASLDDPQGLLAGSGKVHRHVQLWGTKDVEQAGLKQLVDGARALCLQRLKPGTPLSVAAAPAPREPQRR